MACDGGSELQLGSFIAPYAITAAVTSAVAGATYYFRDTLRPLVHRLDIGRLRRLRLAVFSKANLKILYDYVTFQIVSSTSFTLDVTFPDMFTNFLSWLNVLTLDMFGETSGV